MLWLLAWRNLLSRPLQHGLTLLVAALAAGLALAALLALQVVEAGTTRAAQPFEMVVGVKGSPNQLALNTIFLQDAPAGNLKHDFLENLHRDERVQTAVPIGLGDHYRGFRLVGTTPGLFTLLRTRADAPPVLTLSAGCMFNNTPFEAVLGSEAARKLGLQVGDSFVSAHGAQAALEEEEHAEHPYLVVGILAPSGIPYDRGIFTPLESLWEAHGQAGEERGVTAVLVRPRTLTGLMQLYQEINAASTAQAIFPGQVMAGLYQLVGQGQQVLTVFAAIVLIMTALTTAISLYWATVERRREIAVLRALGAGRKTVLALTLLQAAMIAAGGILLGGLLGYTAACILSWHLQATTAVAAWPVLQWQELTLMAGLLIICVIAGLIPALQAYRVEATHDQAF